MIWPLLQMTPAAKCWRKLLWTLLGKLEPSSNTIFVIGSTMANPPRSTTDRIDFAALWEQVKSNNRRLDVCPRHFFPHRPAGYRIGQKLRCVHCEGEITLTDAGNYLRGYVAAGGDPADVWPDWKPRESATGRTGVVEGLA